MRPTPARRAGGGGAAPPRGRGAGTAPPHPAPPARGPDLLAHLCIACGRDGGWGFLFGRVLNDQPAMMTAGWSGYACV